MSFYNYERTFYFYNLDMPENKVTKQFVIVLTPNQDIVREQQGLLSCLYVYFEYKCNGIIISSNVIFKVHHAYGPKNVELNLFKSSLVDRKQMDAISENKPKPKDVTTGLSQGRSDTYISITTQFYLQSIQSSKGKIIA